MPPYWICPNCSKSWSFSDLQDIDVGIEGTNDIRTFRNRKALREEKEVTACHPEDECEQVFWYEFVCPDCRAMEEYGLEFKHNRFYEYRNKGKIWNG